VQATYSQVAGVRHPLNRSSPATADWVQHTVPLRYSSIIISWCSVRVGTSASKQRKLDTNVTTDAHCFGYYRINECKKES
jgi:hypothetical protein